MTIKSLVPQNAPKIAYVFCVLLVVLLCIRSCLHTLPDNLKTELVIGNICHFFKSAMVSAGHSNVLEYVNGLSDEQSLPRTVNSQIMCQIISDRLRYSEWPELRKYYKDGIFSDVWGQPIVVTLTTNHAGTGYVIMHSFGKNKKDEKGDGDDIMRWFNADDIDWGGKINRGQPPK